MRSKFQTLVRENPMRIEIARFRRRFLGFGGSGANNAVFALVLLCYTGLVMMVLNMRGDLAPIWLIQFQTALFCFFGPAMLHGAIAGERERRSWDLLLVAPITKAQIVFGKFMGAAAALGVGAIALGIPIVVTTIAYRQTPVTKVLLAEFVSLSFCTLVCAWTLFLSARVRRPFMALGASIGTLALVLLVFPMLIASLIGSDRFTNETFNYLNPFFTLGYVAPEGQLPEGSFIVSAPLFGLPQALIYLGLTAFFLVYAEKTLNFPENEVKFIPHTHHDA